MDKRLENLTPYPKGTSGNPKGSSKRSKIQHKIKTMTQEQLAVLMNEIIDCPPEKLKEKFSEKKTSALQAWIIAGIMKSVQKGDLSQVDIILNRIVGKVKDKVEHSGTIRNEFQDLTEEEADSRIAELEKRLGIT